MYNARRLIGILGNPLWCRALFRNFVAAGVEHTSVLRGLGGCCMVVDIGANRGQFALAARHVWPETKIIAFEPLPRPASVFRRVFSYDQSVCLKEVAVGPDIGQCTMHVSKCDDSSSILPITPLQSEIFPGTEEASTLSISVTTLDSVVQAEEILDPALLKLDVQGYEMDALMGCASLLQRFEWIYCECSFVELYAGQKLATEVIVWLSERGFRLSGVFNTTYDLTGRSVQADLLFSRQP